MNFYKLRFLNTLFILLIGVAVGFLLKKANDGRASQSEPEYKPVYSSNVSQGSREPRRAPSSARAGGDEENPMDEGEEYILPVMEQSQEKPAENPVQETAESPVAEKKDEMALFVKNPELYAKKEVSGKVQMIIAKKLAKGWKLNLLYSQADKELSYLYVEDPDNVSGDSPDFKIGYLYYVKFRSESGDLKKDNALIAIYPTGEKTPWASGVSAIE